MLNEIIIVSGLSGAGKTTVLKTLEDLEYYCIDNLPAPLIEAFVNLARESKEKVALGIDIRDREHMSILPDIITKLSKLYSTKVIFLEADPQIILNRYKATRRKHPLEMGDIRQAIEKEKEFLLPIRKLAGIIIDTTHMNVNELRRFIFELISGGKFEIKLISFGFAKGLPASLDLLFDVRFIPNPYYNEKLKNLTGLDEPVKNYILSKRETQLFLDKLQDILEFLIPQYQKEGKSIIHIGVGCTGGVHRSVTIAEEVAKRLSRNGLQIEVIHRDLER